MSGEKDANPVSVDPRWCVSESIPRPSELTPDSIHEAQQSSSQSTKHDDPELDFYTVYKQVTTEYDTDYMNRYNEDLSSNLIFVGFCDPIIATQR